MKQVLLVYATIEGQTEKIAHTVRDHLTTNGAGVTLLNARDKDAVGALDLAAFDLLVFGASVHAWKIEKEMVAFINSHADIIRSKPRSFFLVLLAVETKDPAIREKSLDDALKHLEKQLSVPFDDVEMIAGALLYTQYPWLMRWMMKRIVKKAGGDTDTSRDYEYTDWDQVADYAKRLA